MVDQALGAFGRDRRHPPPRRGAPPGARGVRRLRPGRGRARHRRQAARGAPSAHPRHQQDRPPREKSALLPLIDVYRKLLDWDDIVPICATRGEGVDQLEEAVVARLPEGPALYPEEMLTDRAERFLAAELIREQAYHLLSDELPYSVAVTIDRFEERDGRKDVVIDAVIHVERDSQKPIVIGEGGRMIKEIGMRARAEIGKLLGCPCHLKLFVRVDPEWTRTGTSLRKLGYE
jgi:GTP-binding protein Era